MKQEQFYLEKPSLKRKSQAIEYIEEHLKYKSNINGSGSLDDNYKDYESWLEKLELGSNPKTCPENKCPGFTYFLIEKNSDEIIGMINIRYNLNEAMLLHGGHIGYGIRPTKRRHGYNKINLYLGLLKCQELNLDKVLLTAYDNNPASVRTILSLGGILENKIEDENEILGRYWIDVSLSIKKNKEIYEKYLAKN